MSDLDYTLVQFALDLGGEVHNWKWIQYAERGTVEQATDSAEVSCKQDTARSRSLLSTVHIRPKCEYRRGAGVLKVIRGHEKLNSAGDEGRKKVSSKRGSIETFSFASRRRLQRELAGVRRDAEMPCFITLTYPELFPNAKRAKRDLKVFSQRLVREFGGLGACWKLEPQERTAPHFHLLSWGISQADLFSWIPYNWFDIAGGGDKKHLRWHLGLAGNKNKPCVSTVENYQHMQRYASKYLAKTFEVTGWQEQWTGRYWGFLQKENIPFGELVKDEITDAEAVKIQRYQRRFAGIRHRGGYSLTTLCDVEQWKEKIGFGGVIEK